VTQRETRGTDESYVSLQRGAAHLRVLRAHADELTPVLLEARGCAARPGAGRGGVSSFHYADGQGFRRECRRGGLIRHFLARTYLLENRPLAEFEIHAEAQAAGLPVAPLLGVAWWRRGPCFRGVIATHAVPGASLTDALRTNPADAATFLKASSDSILNFHDAGFNHADLNANNILLTPDHTAYLLDLDKARHLAPLTPQQRGENLARLRRSLEKLGFPLEYFHLLLQHYPANLLPTHLAHQRQTESPAPHHE